MLFQKRLITALFISLISFNCFSQKKADTAIAVHYQTLDFDVAIFSAYYGPKNTITNRFTPTKQDIDTVELALKMHTKDSNTLYVDKYECVFRKNINNYRRQYFGHITLDGHKILYINAFCSSREHDWLKDEIIVMDGGSCHWQIEFDITTDKLFDLRVNNEE